VLNKTTCQKLLLLAIITVMIASVFTAGMNTANVFAKSKDSKAKADFIKKFGKSVEGKWSKIEVGSYSIFGSNATITPYNKTKTGPVVPPPPPQCKTGEHLEGDKCIPNVIPSDGNSTIVCMVGDISGTAVRDAMVKAGCQAVIALGDLTYSDTLAAFTKNYGDNQFQVIKCDIGNHDSDENAKGKDIIKQAKAYCGDTWWLKVGTSTLFIGLNTNGNLDTQLGVVQGWLMDNQFMAGITKVHITSHKAICDTPPKSHHPELLMTLCNSITAFVPGIVTLYWENGHNHVYAETSDGLIKTIGTGGRSHYDCGTGMGKTHDWTYCNNNDYGFLKYKIDNIKGDTIGNFTSTSGKVIR
jgi:hypothetical protein